MGSALPLFHRVDSHKPQWLPDENLPMLAMLSIRAHLYCPGWQVHPLPKPCSAHGDLQFLSMTVVFGCCFQGGARVPGSAGAPSGRKLQQLDVVLWNQPSLAIQGPFQPARFP